jgi:hypothetical protein
MVMSGEDCRQTLGLHESLHKAIVAVVVAICARTVVLVTNILRIQTGCISLVASRLLKCACSLHRYVDKGQAGDISAVLSTKLITSALEPRDNLMNQHETQYA